MLWVFGLYIFISVSVLWLGRHGLIVLLYFLFLLCMSLKEREHELRCSRSGKDRRVGQENMIRI